MAVFSGLGDCWVCEEELKSLRWLRFTGEVIICRWSLLGLICVPRGPTKSIIWGFWREIEPRGLFYSILFYCCNEYSFDCVVGWLDLSFELFLWLVFLDLIEMFLCLKSYCFLYDWILSMASLYLGLCIVLTFLLLIKLAIICIWWISAFSEISIIFRSISAISFERTLCFKSS